MTLIGERSERLVGDREIERSRTRDQHIISVLRC